MEKQKNGSTEQCRSVPKLRFPGFEDSWTNEKMGKLFSFKVTNSFSRENLNYEVGSVKNIHYGDIHKNFHSLFDITKEFVPFINPEIAIDRISKDNYCQEGDLILADASEDLADVGKSIELVNLNNENLLSGLHTILARPEKEKFRIGFIGYLFKSNWVRTLIQKESQGSKVLSISSTRLSNISLLFPSKEEQSRIASFFSAIDEKLKLETQRMAALKQYKKGVMQKLFSQELRFKDENGKEFPDWEVKKLGEIAIFRRGSFPQPYGLPKWYDDENGMPFIQVFDVDDNMLLKATTKNKISKLGALQSVFVKKGTLVITIQGSIGRIAKTQYDAYVDRTLLIFQSYKLPLNIDYFKFVLFLLFEIEKTKAPGGTIKTITKEVLTDFTVPIPSHSEQTKIAHFLSAIDDKIDQAEKRFLRIQMYKKGLLQNMFV